MIETVFVDTNVFLYWVDAADPVKQQRAAAWIAEIWKRNSGRVSFQVLQEFFAQAARKRPDLCEQFRAEARHLLAWQPVVIDAALLEHAWSLQDRYLLSFWDSLIVAAAKAASCRWLLTEDLQANQVLDGVTVINPFEVTPDQLPA